MNYKNIIKLLAVTGVWLSVILSLSIVVGVIYHENFIPFLVSDALFFAFSFLIYYLFREHTFDLSIKESILSVNLIWILLGFIGGVPFMLYTNVDMASAFFEAISGFTTTGATVYTDIESLSHMILFHRSLMHWLGGMGVIVLGVGLLSIINPTGSMALFKSESTGFGVDKITPKIKDTAISLWGIYMLFTSLDAILLMSAGMGGFDAINHAFSTISTGGFSTKNDSLGFYSDNIAIVWITTVFMFISGINFVVHLRTLQKDFTGYKSDEVLTYLKLFIVISIILALIHYTTSNDTLSHTITHSFFTIASVMTTTGFITLDYETWGHIAIGIVIFSMFLGANAGSTAGGMKTIRYVIIVKSLISELKRMLHPQAIINIFVNGKIIKKEIIFSTYGFLFLYLFTVLLVALYLFARDFDTLTSLTAALAMVGNIGPGFALAGPTESYGMFTWYDKIILSFAMMIGRLECYTFFLLFFRDFWKKF
jgi:trk system potassium uptake protein TrkH